MSEITMALWLLLILGMGVWITAKEINMNEDIKWLLDHCGPRRSSGTAELTTEEAAKAWMLRMLKSENGAEAIALTLTAVWDATAHTRR